MCGFTAFLCCQPQAVPAELHRFFRCPVFRGLLQPLCLCGLPDPFAGSAPEDVVLIFRPLVPLRVMFKGHRGNTVLRIIVIMLAYRAVTHPALRHSAEAVIRVIVFLTGGDLVIKYHLPLMPQQVRRFVIQKQLFTEPVQTPGQLPKRIITVGFILPVTLSGGESVCP